MLKRDLAAVAGAAVDLDGPRTKRRREAAATSPLAKEEKANVEESAAENATQERVLDPGQVREQGLTLWQAVKDAVDKENRKLSLEFLRQPSKRLYPDYYTIIDKPIALEDIKKQLDEYTYTSLEAVKKDLEQCFINAKRYNQRDSSIWKDAKVLHKLTKTTYSKLSGGGDESDHVNVVDEDDHENGVEGAGDDAEDKKKKSKQPNMTRLLKSRLQKLVDKTDESGRVLSTEFMELPSKKKWPVYYQEIKRPQCLENIFKRLKRKEYHNTADFAAEVELVFSNAMHFNEDHSQVWEDALALRDQFRQLMSDLPPPFALAEYLKPSHNKIRLKVPAASSQKAALSAPESSSPPVVQSTSSSSSLTLRLPAASSASPAQPVPSPTQVNAAPSPVPPAVTPSTQATTSVLPNTNTMRPTSIQAPQPTQAPKGDIASSSTTPRPVTLPTAISSSSYSQHYPNATYHPQPASTSVVQSPPPVAPPTPVASAVLAAPVAPAAPVVPAAPVTPLAKQHAMAALANLKTHSPSPTSQHPHRVLKSVQLTTEPRGRKLLLDYRDGVKSWVTRLMPGEKGLTVNDVKFLEDEEEGSSDEEDQPAEDAEEQETPAPVKASRGRGRPRGRGRGRPRGRPRIHEKEKEREKPEPVRALKIKVKPVKEEIQLSLNSSVIKETSEYSGEWKITLVNSSSILEVGEKGGMVWKVYLERIPDASY